MNRLKSEHYIALFVFLLGFGATLMDTTDYWWVWAALWLGIATGVGVLWHVITTGGWSLRAKIQLPAFRALAVAVLGAVVVAGVTVLWLQFGGAAFNPLTVWLVSAIGSFLVARQMRTPLTGTVAGATAGVLAALAFTGVVAYWDFATGDHNWRGFATFVTLIVSLTIAPLTGLVLGFAAQLRRPPELTELA